MDRSEQAKVAAEKLMAEKGAIGLVPGQVVDLCEKPAKANPRELLLRDLADQEQRLLDKLFALRELRNEYQFCSYDEAERLLKVGRIAERLLR